MFTWALLASSLYGGMTVASAWVLGAITTRVLLPSFATGTTTASALTLAALAILGVAVFKILGILGRRLFAGIMSYRLMADYRRRVTGQYLRLPLSWHQRHPTGQLLSNANSDVESAWFFVAPLPFACGALVMMAITVISLVATDPLLALVGFVVFPAVFVVNIVYSQVMSPRMQRAQQLRAEVSEIAHESFDAALVVKTLGREESETERFAVRSRELRDGLVAVGKVRGLFDPLMEALPSLGTLAVLLIGAHRVAAGTTTPGDLVSIAYLFTLLALPVRAIGWVLADLPRALAGFERVTPVLDATGETHYGPDQAPAGDGGAHLGIDGIDFAFEGTGRPVLSDITFDVPAGTTVAVVGPTGSGKSTLAGLLVRLVDPDGGEVLLDRVDVRRLREGALSDQAAFVAQGTFLFDDTVRGNVTLGGDFSDDEVRTALRVAAADEFVAALPDGLDTRVGERGATLSGGQRQRLALARAVVRRPRLLVLDDATSAVDPSVEARILDALRASNQPTTVVVIAYRQATIGLADEVVWIEHGRVVARGSHDELLAAVPGYAALVRAYSQAELAA
jgi:ABC-type multidrug transport system fused ATPase/permease subunit